MFAKLLWLAESFDDPFAWELRDFGRVFDLQQRLANHGPFAPTVNEYGKNNREVVAEYDALIGKSFAEDGEEKTVGYIRKEVQRLSYRDSAYAQENNFHNLARLICLALSTKPQEQRPLPRCFEPETQIKVTYGC